MVLGMGIAIASDGKWVWTMVVMSLLMVEGEQWLCY